MKPLTVQHVNSPVPATSKGMPSLQRGLSLVELMISITIGLLILASLTTLFVNQSRTRAELDKSNRMIDNGRYALEVLSDNLSMAGFYGEFVPATGDPSIPASLPDPCATSGDDIKAALQLAVQGYEADSPTSQIAGPPCSFTYTAGNDRSLKAGSDILAMRRASTGNPIARSAALDGTHYLQVSYCEHDAATHTVSTSKASLILREKACTPASTAYAQVRNFLVHVYFVSSNTKPGDSIPTLKRLELDPTDHIFKVTPLVEGIEYMQIDYGLDTDTGTGTDGVPDSYVESPAATDWPNVVTVRMNILARNTETTQGYTDTKTYALGLAGTFGPFGDGYKRHVYTQFIRLNNPAGRREPP